MSVDRVVSQGIGDRIASVVGGPAGRRMAQWNGLVPLIGSYEEGYKNLDDRQLRKESLSLRFRARSGESLSALLPEAFGLVRETARRTIGLRHFDVQLIGGIALFHGAIAEMDTGEGKTLTATLPVYLRALMGRGVHLATVNDYLAERDTEEMGPVYEKLGLSAGVVLSQDTPEARRRAYDCDITYGTAKEFGFDFLRDRLLLRRLGREMDDFLGEGSSQRWDESGDKPVQRGAYFALVDEADSILIDEARTPLIIGSLGEEAREQMVATYQWAARHAAAFEEDVDFEYDHEKRKVELTYEGRHRMRALPRDELVSEVGLVDQYEYTERAIKVKRDFHLDQQYVVRDGEIVIVDEYTGRMAEGRKWRDGIHQAIEAKQEVEITVPTGQAARITVQDLFLRYEHLAGMTGTARTAAKEFRKIYRHRVYQIPTNRPRNRSRLAARVYATTDQKLEAITEEVKELHTAGRPVLIGTRTIEKSERLSALLDEAGIPHEVLNAREIEHEADIVAAAGQHGKVTVATNMAGRGTDIKLQEGIAEKGGLHVICTELHESARIDRQLIGRCGRQGDPGSYRQFMAVEDEILQEGFGPDRAQRLQQQTSDMGGELGNFRSVLRRAQQKVERKHFQDRNVLLHHERERKKLQKELGQDPYLDTAE